MFRLGLILILIFCLAVIILAYEMDSDSLQDQYEKEQFNLRKKICLQGPEYGKCKGRRTLWYYNTNRSKCQTFTYSNCGGNGNLFYTYESCKEFCGKYNWHKGPPVKERRRMAAARNKQLDKIPQ
ncbi:PI-stichotoxin-Hmg3d [Drosophila biarmipes]|uniref:PI-stichotoxin-Hmg3d n=1 Tax=Drosophila biarmipes TaxID=125945 RepID=UPI0007E6CB48|nr:PI-stichotoxin-Hmg3d [Drosophila biarmipes]